MRLLVYGSGAIGGTLAAGLADGGCEVFLVARGAHGMAIGSGGLRVARPSGTRSYPFEVAASAVAADFPPVDAVLLCVKSQDTPGALDDLYRAGYAGVPVICAQNGVANERLLQPRFERIYGMLVWIPASHLEPGAVGQFAEGPAGCLMVGRFPDGIDSVCERLSDALVEGGFDARPVDAIDTWKHGKLLLNLGNAIDAYCGPGEGRRPFRAKVAAEACAVLDAAGIDYIDRDTLLEAAGGVIAVPIDGEERGGGSTWQSAVRGQSSEVDFLNGHICEVGARVGVPTPYNRALVDLARSRPAPRSIDIDSLLPDTEKK